MKRFKRALVGLGVVSAVIFVLFNSDKIMEKIDTVLTELKARSRT